MDSLVNLTIHLVAMALLVEFLVERIKNAIPESLMKHINPTWISITISLVIAFMFNLDIFAILDMSSSIPYAAQIITGLAISAGTDALHVLLNSWKTLSSSVAVKESPDISTALLKSELEEAVNNIKINLNESENDYE